jgi:hypothetical protein
VSEYSSYTTGVVEHPFRFIGSVFLKDKISRQILILVSLFMLTYIQIHGHMNKMLKWINVNLFARKLDTFDTCLNVLTATLSNNLQVDNLDT